MDRYEEALEKARAEYEKAREQGYTWLMALLEGMFPELKESERVRKEIIHYILYKADGVSEKQGHEWVAWLEKHKINTEGNFDRGFCYGYDCGYQAGYAIAKNEMKPKVAHASLDSEKQKEQKGANGNEKEIPNGQKPAVWSEEDEEMLNSCISSIEEAKENRYAYKETDGDTSYDHEIAWLKSLRPPQYCENCKLKRSVENWKPSEEQMAALEKVRHSLHTKELWAENNPVVYAYESLIRDLHKLL